MNDIATALFNLEPRLQERAKFGNDYVLIQCPFHGDGKENTPSCSVSLEKPVFHCHACQTSGHISRLFQSLGMDRASIDVVLRLTGMDVRKQETAVYGRGKLAARIVNGGYNPFRGKYILDEDLLDAYRHAPKSLLRAGYKKRTLHHFEVGYDFQNLRITYPLRNMYGDLVGISGRAVYDGDEPRYKIYDQELRFREGFSVPEDYSMESVKDALLWHGHIVRPFLYKDDTEALVVTEGFKACMWTWQSGYENTVALIGAYLSDLHAELITTVVKYVVLFLDNNEAGIRGTHFAGWKLSQRGVHVLIANYPDEREQPDDLTPDEVKLAIKTSKPFHTWRTT